jgi:dienelactone hydrolase
MERQILSQREIDERFSGSTRILSRPHRSPHVPAALGSHHGYNEAQAKIAWDRTIAFFKKNLVA